MRLSQNEGTVKVIKSHAYSSQRNHRDFINVAEKKCVHSASHCMFQIKLKKLNINVATKSGNPQHEWWTKKPDACRLKITHYHM